MFPTLQLHNTHVGDIMLLYLSIGDFLVTHSLGKSSLVVAARTAESLEKLKNAYAPELRSADSTGSSRPFQASISKEHWAEAMVRVVLEMEYTSFEPTPVKVVTFRRDGPGPVLRDQKRVKKIPQSH